MKKKRKKINKKKKNSSLRKSIKIIKIKKKKSKKKKKKSNKTKIKSKQKLLKKLIKKKSDNFISKSVRLEESIKSKFSFKFNIDFLAVDRFIAKFFQKIEEKIQKFKSLRSEEKRRLKLEAIEEKRRLKLEAIENVEKEKLKLEKEKKEKEALQFKLKEKQLKDEQRLEKERNKDIKLFLRKEQAILRKEQAQRQRKFLEELKLDKQIEKFRVREVKELEKLEKISLKEKREDYSGLQERIEKLKNKYRLIRDQKIKERVEALGVRIIESDDRGTLLQKEREYYLARQKIELALESFYRSANSLVFQLNKRYITRHMSILKCIDRRFETGEIFIKWDESLDEEWLILIYIKDNSPDEGIVIEDKSNEEKSLSHEFKPSEIFKASDMMVDALTQLISRKRNKKE
jgi:hypothetical protein